MGVPINKKKKLQAMRVRCVGMKCGECPIPRFSFALLEGEERRGKREEGKSQEKINKRLKNWCSFFK